MLDTKWGIADGIEPTIAISEPKSKASETAEEYCHWG